MNKVWMLRPFPHRINRMREFLNDGLIACGWPLTGDLNGKTRENLKTILGKPPYNYGSLELGQSYGSLDILVNQMEIGDLVLVPDGSEINIGEITSGYRYTPSLANDTDGYPHQRNVKWVKKLLRTDLSNALRSSLRAQQTATNLTKHFNEINALAHGTQLPINLSADENVSVAYPLRPDVTVTISVPKDITKIEAERLGDFIKTLYY